MQPLTITELPASSGLELEVLEGAQHENGNHEHNGGDDSNGNGVNGHARKRHWSLDEMRSVAAGIAKMLRKQGLRHVPEVGDHTGRRFLLDFLREAQIVLPSERRRMTAQLAAFSPIFWKLVEDALTTKTEASAPVETEKPPVIETGGAENPATSVRTAPPVGYALVKEDDPLANVPLGALLRAAFARIVDTLDTVTAKNRELLEANQLLNEEVQRMSASHETIMRRLANHDTALGNLPAQVRTVLPRVAICACRRDELDHIQAGAEKHGLKLDFRLYEQGDKPKSIEADWAIMMKWGSHPLFDQIQANIPAGQYAFTTGGISSVIAQLRQWFQPGFKA